jgi:tetrapyrrole methylase family protein/MazG family protein/ATP diphosphatase
MARLRDPERGCPWDLEQSFATIAPYTIEEAYEVIDAIERGDLAALADELGDLLLQVVFHSQMASEQGAFTFADVTRHICNKMIRRHPHVFGEARVENAAAQTLAWEQLKRAETHAAQEDDAVLDRVTRALPALTRAVKLGGRAARVGFDWPDSAGPRGKIDEELAELDEAIGSAERTRIEHEVGDLLFAVANLCRHLDVDPEQCARGANRRFEARFAHVERRVRASARGWTQHSLAELDAYWSEAKEHEAAAEPRDPASA